MKAIVLMCLVLAGCGGAGSDTSCEPYDGEGPANCVDGEWVPFETHPGAGSNIGAFTSGDSQPPNQEMRIIKDELFWCKYNLEVWKAEAKRCSNK